MSYAIPITTLIKAIWYSFSSYFRSQFLYGVIACSAFIVFLHMAANHEYGNNVVELNFGGFDEFYFYNLLETDLRH